MERSAAERLVVADSFRVRVHEGQAEVRGCERHVERFTRSVFAVTRGTFAVPDTFLRAARADISDFGEGFPRLELWELAPGRFAPRLSLRPLPELRDTIDVRTAAGVELERPSVKGANLAHLGDLNRSLDAEALLVGPDGQVVEGATTAVLWWDGGVLCAVQNTARVQSVAEALLLDAAARVGVATSHRAITPEQLRHHEAWAANALHGLRRIGSIDGAPAAPPSGARLGTFRELLERTWLPVRLG